MIGCLTDGEVGQDRSGSSSAVPDCDSSCVIQHTAHVRKVHSQHSTGPGSKLLKPYRVRELAQSTGVGTEYGSKQKQYRV